MAQKIILLIEDDELDVISIKRILQNYHGEYDLYTAFNGIDALDLLNRKSPIFPDVILLDLSMPKMNGFEFLEVLRNDKRFENVPKFVLTTSTTTEDRKRTERFGISGYIIKPLNYTSNTNNVDSMDSFFQFHLRKILLGT